MTGTTPQIRIARADPATLELAVDLFMGYLDFYHRPHGRAEVTAFIAERQQAPVPSILLLAWLLPGDHPPAGLAHVYPTFSTLSLSASWHLNDLYVRPDARGHGVGRALLHAVCAQARDSGAAHVSLETTRDNGSARSLYQSQGFAIESEVVHYTLPLSSHRETRRPGEQ